MDDLGTAYSNLADLLNLAGRTARRAGGDRRGSRRGPDATWPGIRLDGDDALGARVRGRRLGRRARDAGRRSASLVGVSLIFRLLRDAELALGEGDESLARRAPRQPSRSCASPARRSGTGCSARCWASCSRRGGDLEEAPGGGCAALDELEVCTDDVMRIARVTAVGLRSRPIARCVRATCASPRPSATRLARARIHLDRLEAAARGRRAGRARLAGHRDRRGGARPRSQRPGALATGGGALGSARAAVLRGADARWRQAEALVEPAIRPAAAVVRSRRSRLRSGWARAG